MFGFLENYFNSLHCLSAKIPSKQTRTSHFPRPLSTLIFHTHHSSRTTPSNGMRHGCCENSPEPARQLAWSSFVGVASLSELDHVAISRMPRCRERSRHFHALCKGGFGYLLPLSCVVYKHSASRKRTFARGEHFVRLVFVGGSLGMEALFRNVGSVEWIWSRF